MNSDKEYFTQASEKNSYILKENTSRRALEILNEKEDSGFKSLCITRTHPEELKEKHNFNSSIIWLTSEKKFNSSNIEAISEISLLKEKINSFINNNKKSVVLIDRVDYLINMHGFNETLKLIYSLNDKVLSKKSIFMINVNPQTLKNQELSLLEQELKELKNPQKEIFTELEDDLHEILLFVNNNNKVSFKNVSREFSITKTTTRKRINRLLEESLVSVKKNGRNKVIRITEKGSDFL